MSRKILETGLSRTDPDPIASFGDWDAFFDDKVAILKGAPLTPTLKRKIIIQVEDNHPEQAPPGLTDFFTNQTFQIASAKLKSALDVFAKDIEFVPVTLHYHGKLIENKYFILHPLHSIKGLDRNRSAFDEDEGFVCSISKLVLDESKFEHVDWAALYEASPVVVSEAVQRAMKDSGCSGFQFTEVADFRMGC